MGTNPTLQYSDTIEQKAFNTLRPLHWRELHCSINKHLCSLVSGGTGFEKRSHVSLKHLPQRFLFFFFLWKQLIKTEPCVWYLFRRFALVHFELRRWNSFRKWKNYIVQSEILTISLQERKVIKNDLCPPSFRIHIGKSIILVLLLRFLVNFHICVDLPHEGTCSHVSDGTWNKQMCSVSLLGGLQLQVSHSRFPGKSITGRNDYWWGYLIKDWARKSTSFIHKITSQTPTDPEATM